MRVLQLRNDRGVLALRAIERRHTPRRAVAKPRSDAQPCLRQVLPCIINHVLRRARHRAQRSHMHVSIETLGVRVGVDQELRHRGAPLEINKLRLMIKRRAWTRNRLSGARGCRKGACAHLCGDVLSQCMRLRLQLLAINLAESMHGAAATHARKLSCIPDACRARRTRAL